MPKGHKYLAIDSVRLRWAALAEAKAAVLIPPRLEAVAPSDNNVAVAFFLHLGNDSLADSE